MIDNSLLRFEQWTIGQALEGALYPASLNGSLWSIFPEFACYLMTILIGLLGVHNQNKNLFLGMLGFVSVVHVIITTHDGAVTPAMGPTLLTQSGQTMFYLAYLIGAALWIFREQFRPNSSGCVFAGLLLLIAMKFGGLDLISPFVFPVFLIYLAHLFVCPLKWDLSYGIYLYHFPIFQVLALSDWLVEKKLLFLGAGLAGTLILASVSWICVEHPALQLKPRRGKDRSARANQEPRSDPEQISENRKPTTREENLPHHQTQDPRTSG